MNDRDRKWVREAPTPAAYASGVGCSPQNAQKELSCDELAVGRREAEKRAFRAARTGSTSLTPAQVSRGVMLVPRFRVSWQPR